MKSNNRQKLVATTQKLMHIQGFNKTSLDKIMTEAEVCKSNFYYYFKSKEALGLITTKKMIKDFCEKILDITLLNKNLNPDERFKAFQGMSITLHKTYLKEYDRYPGCFFGNLTIEQSGNEKFVALIRGFFKKWTDALRGCLEEGVEQGHFTKRFTPDEMVVFIVSQMEGAILLSRAQGDIEPFISTCKTMRDMIVTGDGKRREQ